MVGGGKASEEEQHFVTHKNYLKFKFHFAKIQAFWSTAMPVCHILSTAQWQSVAVTETVARKPKCFALWPSVQKVYQPWSKAPPALEASA